MPEMVSSEFHSIYKTIAKAKRPTPYAIRTKRPIQIAFIGFHYRVPVVSLCQFINSLVLPPEVASESESRNAISFCVKIEGSHSVKDH